jgi:hypothetical protein
VVIKDSGSILKQHLPWSFCGSKDDKNIYFTVFIFCTCHRFYIKYVFGSVVVVAFQIAFRAEIHANDVFLFFKNHF